MKITVKDEHYWDWNHEYDLMRRIDKTVKSIFNLKSITDENKDQYVRVCKLLYQNNDTRLAINKYVNRLKRMIERAVEEGIELKVEFI